MFNKSENDIPLSSVFKLSWFGLTIGLTTIVLPLVLVIYLIELIDSQLSILEVILMGVGILVAILIGVPVQSVFYALFVVFGLWVYRTYKGTRVSSKAESAPTSENG